MTYILFPRSGTQGSGLGKRENDLFQLNYRPHNLGLASRSHTTVVLVLVLPVTLYYNTYRCILLPIRDYVFVAGWRHALRSEWPFIIIIIIRDYYSEAAW